MTVKLDFGFGNNSDCLAKQREILDSCEFQFVQTKRSGSFARTIGGNFNFEFFGSNELDEFLTPECLGEDSEIYDLVIKDVIPKRKLTELYLQKLSPEALEAIRREMIIAYLIR